MEPQIFIRIAGDRLQFINNFNPMYSHIEYFYLISQVKFTDFLENKVDFHKIFVVIQFGYLIFVHFLISKFNNYNNYLPISKSFFQGYS